MLMLNMIKTSKYRILVVDDDPDFRLQQALSLKAAGYEVVTAGNRAEAEALLTDSGLDVTIFRPSVVFGPGDSFFRRFARLLRFAWQTKKVE